MVLLWLVVMKCLLISFDWVSLWVCLVVLGYVLWLVSLFMPIRGW